MTESEEVVQAPSIRDLLADNYQLDRKQATEYDPRYLENSQLSAS
jgi:hypothetical protein